LAGSENMAGRWFDSTVGCPLPAPGIFPMCACSPAKHPRTWAFCTRQGFRIPPLTNGGCAGLRPSLGHLSA